MVEITLQAPGKNALGSALIHAVTSQLRAAAGAPLLISGSGGAFSAGLNLKEVASLDTDGVVAFLRSLEEMVAALYQYPGPVVALVNGHAIAGGCVLALCCDRRILVHDPRIRVGLNEIALGLRFPPRTFEIVRRRVPRQHHEEVLLGGSLFGPEDAARVGLVDTVAKGEEAVALARQELARLAAIPAHAYADLKRELRGYSAESLCAEGPWQAALAAMLPAWTSPELKQRLLEVLAK